MHNRWLALVLLGCVTTHEAAARKELDSIVARVGSRLITQTDLDEPQVAKGNRKNTLDQAILEAIYEQKAIELKIASQDDAVDRAERLFLKQVFGLVDVSRSATAEIDAKLKAIDPNLTRDRLRRQLLRSRLADLVDHELIPKDALVTREEVADYCHAHPAYLPAATQVAFATVEPDNLSLNGKRVVEPDELEWTVLDEWYEDGTQEGPAAMVSSLGEDELSEVVTKGSLRCVYKVAARREHRLLTPDERYEQVHSILVEQKRKLRAEEAIEGLRNEAAVQIYDSVTGRPKKDFTLRLF